MAFEWTTLARDIEDQPIPPDQTRCVDITCNDCEVRQKNRRWHYLGVQCGECGSFNTTHSVTMAGVEANEFLNVIEAERNK